MASAIVLNQRDNGIKIVFNITKDKIIEPLSGAKVYLKFRNRETDEEFDRLGVITDEARAEVTYVFTRSDLSNIGRFNVEVETHFANGSILSCKNPLLLSIVKEDFTNTDDIQL